MGRVLSLLLIGALTLAAPAAVRADDGCPMCEGKGMDGGQKADKLGVLLDLTDKQKAEVKKLADDHYAKVKPVMEEQMKRMKAMKEEFKAGLDKILTEKQRQKLAAWKDMEGKRGDHKHGH